MYQQKQQQQQLSVIYTPSPRESSCGAIPICIKSRLLLSYLCAADNKGDPREHLHLNFCRPSPTQPANRQSIYPPIIPQSHGTSFTSIKLAGKALRPTKRTLTPFRSPSSFESTTSVTNTSQCGWLRPWLFRPKEESITALYSKA